MTKRAKHGPQARRDDTMWKRTDAELDPLFDKIKTRRIAELGKVSHSLKPDDINSLRILRDELIEKEYFSRQSKGRERKH